MLSRPVGSPVKVFDLATGRRQQERSGEQILKGFDRSGPGCLQYPSNLGQGLVVGSGANYDRTHHVPQVTSGGLNSSGGPVNTVKTADINGTQIAYADSGPADGVPVVLSHSLFFDHTMFEELGALLAQAGHRVVAYDHRGQGASQAATRDELSMDALTDDAAALITELGLGRVHFLGNSMGGFIALRLAARYPELLLSATAVGSSAEEEHQLEQFGPIVERLGEVGGAELIDTLLYIMFGDTSLAANTPEVQQWRAFMEKLDPGIGDAAFQVIHRESIVGELAGVGVPVLAISGSEDHAYPPPISDENIAAATGGDHVRVDQAGHSTSLEQSQLVAEHVLRFIQALPAA